MPEVEVMCPRCGRAFRTFLRDMEKHNQQVVCPHCAQPATPEAPSAESAPSRPE